MGYWKEIKNNLINENNVIYIDAWKTNSSLEEGVTIALVDVHGDVIYLHDKADKDAEAQKIIQETSIKRKQKHFNLLSKYISKKVSCKKDKNNNYVLVTNDGVVLYNELNNVDYNKLKYHVGHSISIVYYENKETKEVCNISIECNDCNEVLYDVDFMSFDAMKIKYKRIMLFDIDALLTDYHLDSKTIPTEIYCYELRASDENLDCPFSLEKKAITNYCGTVLLKEPLNEVEKGNHIYIKDKIVYLVDGVNLEMFLHNYFF